MGIVSLSADRKISAGPNLMLFENRASHSYAPPSLLSGATGSPEDVIEHLSTECVIGGNGV